MRYLLDSTVLIDHSHDHPGVNELLESLFAETGDLYTCDVVVTEALSKGTDEEIAWINKGRVDGEKLDPPCPSGPSPVPGAGLALSGGGIRSSPSAVSIRRTTSLALGSPGTMATLPLLPGPIAPSRTSRRRPPLRAAASAVTWAANGVLFRLPLKPQVPPLAQQRVSPLVSVIVTVVLLKLAVM